MKRLTAWFDETGSLTATNSLCRKGVIKRVAPLVLMALFTGACTIEPKGCLHLQAGVEDHAAISEVVLQIAEQLDLEVLTNIDRQTARDHPDFLIELKGGGSYVNVRHGIGDPWVCTYGFTKERPLAVLEAFRLAFEESGIQANRSR